MIAYLKGKVIGKGENYIVVENNGIGYKVLTTPKIIESAIGAELALHTYLHVREDAMVLFGFGSAADIAFFELLNTVSGVGPKMALSILSAENTDLIKGAIASQDAAIFTRIGGVGRKTAEKIILELKDKMGAAPGAAMPANSEDIFVALENLGYSNREISEVVKKLNPSLPLEERMRQALKLLSK